MSYGESYIVVLCHELIFFYITLIWPPVLFLLLRKEIILLLRSCVVALCPLFNGKQQYSSPVSKLVPCILFSHHLAKSHVPILSAWIYHGIQTDLATEQQHTKKVNLFDQSLPMKNTIWGRIGRRGTHSCNNYRDNRGLFMGEMCRLNAPSHCMVGIPCPDSLPFSDVLDQNMILSLSSRDKPIYRYL